MPDQAKTHGDRPASVTTSKSNRAPCHPLPHLCFFFHMLCCAPMCSLLMRCRIRGRCTLNEVLRKRSSFRNRRIHDECQHVRAQHLSTSTWCSSTDDGTLEEEQHQPDTQARRNSITATCLSQHGYGSVVVVVLVVVVVVFVVVVLGVCMFRWFLFVFFVCVCFVATFGVRDARYF